MSNKSKKLTVSIGISAYNEEKNIGHLLQSVINQKCWSYELQKIYVICDGCSDSTADIVQAWQRQYSLISLKNYKRRLGKNARLNELYEENNSDYLFTLDADLLLGTDLEIEKLLDVALKTKAKVIAAHMIPLPVQGFVKRIVYANHCLWTEVRIHVNGGDYFDNLQGGATLIAHNFAKKMRYPVDIPGDGMYLYIKASQRNTFAFSPTNQVIYRPLGSLREWHRLNHRILSRHHHMRKFFDEHISQLYPPPFKYVLRGIIVQLKRDPLFTLLAIGMNFLFKFIIPFQRPTVTSFWPTLNSTKETIELTTKKEQERKLV